MANDEILFKVNPKLSIYLPSIILLAFVGLMILFPSLSTKEGAGVGVTISFIFFIGALYQYLKVQFTIYTLTAKSLIIQSGIISMFKQTIPLNKVQDVTLNYGIIQRLFGCGDVLLDTAGAYKNTAIKNIANPEEISEKILSLIHKSANIGL